MHDGMPYGRIQGQGHELIQGSSIENLQSREVDRQSPTGLIFYMYSGIVQLMFICVKEKEKNVSKCIPSILID